MAVVKQPDLSILQRDERHITLVPNRRHAEALVAREFQSRKPAGGVLPAPPVYVFSEWLEQKLVEAMLLAGESAPVVVRGFELQLLWEEVIRRGAGIDGSGRLTPLAGLARNAQRLLHNWQVDVSPAYPQEEWQAFQSWRREVKQRLTRQGRISAEQVITVFSCWLEDGNKLELPAEITLHGYAELLPVEVECINILEKHDVKIILKSKTLNSCKTRLRLEFDDFETELAAAASWAGQRLEAGDSSIAIVINELQNRLPLVSRVFENFFHPDRLLGFENLAEAEFHQTVGTPLSEFGPVADALLLLRICATGGTEKIPIADWSRLLLSPGWGGDEAHWSLLALLEQRLRGGNRNRLNIHQLLNQTEFHGLAEGLASWCVSWRTVLADKKRTNPVNIITGWLNLWHWPGPLLTDLQANPRLSQFIRLLDRLAALRPDSLAQALQWLQRLCQQTRPVTIGGVLSPVQILTPEDAVDQSFDAAWVLNLRQDNWPASPKPNPLIPAVCWDQLPRFTADNEWAYIRKLTTAMLKLAPEVRCSSSLHEQDVHYGPSPLIDNLPLTETGQPVHDPELLIQAAPAAQEIHSYRDHPWLTATTDEQGKPFPESTAATGGSGLISMQAWSPLAAYLVYRLNARTNSFAEDFPDPASRGSLLHWALEALYAPLLGSGGRPGQDQVPAAVARALDKAGKLFALSTELQEAERLRLEELLGEWLEFEQQRGPFVIRQTEHSIDGSLGAVPLKLRLDRLDQLDDGRLLIIDYKSGNTDVRGWANERLLDPQLPLYARLLRQQRLDVAGLGLARVRHGDCSMLGIADDPALAATGFAAFGSQPKSRSALVRDYPDWTTLLVSWDDKLDSLASEIEQGVCRNQLFDDQQLRFADCVPLLRIQEGREWLQEHDNEPPG